MCSTYNLVLFLVISFYENSFYSFVYVIVYCVGAEIVTLVSISDGLNLYIFPLKDGKDMVC